MGFFLPFLMYLVALSSAFGAPQDILEIEDPEEFERLVLDAPNEYSEFMKAQLKSLDRSRDFNKLLRVYLYFAWDQSLLDYQTPEEIAQVLEESWRRKLTYEWTAIRSTIVYYSSFTKDFKVEEFEQILRQLEPGKDERSLAYVQALQSYHYLNIKKFDEALKKIKEAKAHLALVEKPSPFLVDAVQLAFASALYYRKQFEACLEVRLAVDAYYAEHGIRTQRSFNLFGIGQIHLKLGSDLDLKKALDYFTKAHALAKSVHSLTNIAIAEFGLGEAYLRLKNYEQSIQHSNEAIQIYRNIPDNGYLARVFAQQARVYTEAGRLDEALKAIKLAEEKYSKNQVTDRNELRMLKYKLAKQSKNYKEAADYLEEYLAVYKDISAAEAKDEFQRLSVDLGLKYEEERNNQLKQQVELLQNFRWLSILAVTLASVCLIAFIVVLRQRREIQKSRRQIKNALKEIVHKNSEMQIFIDEIPGALASFDEAMVVNAQNFVFKTLVKNEDKELLQLLNARLQLFKNAGKISEIERVGLPIDAPRRWFDLSMKSYQLQDKACHLILMIDVSERVLLEQSLEVARARSYQAMHLQGLAEMAGGIAHEINNPLAIISGRCHQIRTILSQKDATLPADLILKACDNIEKIVDRIARIVLLLRIYSEDSSDETAQVGSLVSIIDDALTLMHDKITKNHFEVSVQHDVEKVSCLLFRQKLIKAVVALVTNAIEASLPTDQRKIEIRVEHTPENNLRTTISDYGVGVAEPGKLFVAFYTTKDVGAGMGVGLSTVHGIINGHGGRVFLVSAKNPTSFAFEIPVQTQIGDQSAA